MRNETKRTKQRGEEKERRNHTFLALHFPRVGLFSVPRSQTTFDLMNDCAKERILHSGDGGSGSGGGNMADKDRDREENIYYKNFFSFEKGKLK